jgi:hypothetical protein
VLKPGGRAKIPGESVYQGNVEVTLDIFRVPRGLKNTSHQDDPCRGPPPHRSIFQVLTIVSSPGIGQKHIGEKRGFRTGRFMAE